MEKFNTWADAFTGVQPFLPLAPNLGDVSSGAKAAYWLKWLLLAPIVAIIRLPLILFLFLLLWLVDLVAVVIPAPPLRRLFERAEHLVIVRFLLFLMGFYSIDASYMPSKRGNRTPSANPGDSALDGHVIIANHVSYVDLLYLQFTFSPVFTTLPNTWEGDNIPRGVVIQRSFFGAFKDIISQPHYTADQAVPLEKLIENAKKYKRGPVVIFPEATTTNGKVLLGSIPAITPQNTPVAKEIHMLSFKYEHTDFSPVYTCGSFVWHFLRLISQISNDLSVRYVIDADIPALADGTNAEEWIDNLYTLLSTAMQKRRAKITVKEKFPFLQYYTQYYKQYKR